MKELILKYGMKDTDKDLVYATFLQGLYYGNDCLGMMPKGTFFEKYGKVLDQLFSRPEILVIKAVLPDDEDIIIGYAIVEGNETLHWVYVKPAWRNEGVARKMVDQIKLEAVTHLTEVGKKILSNNKQNIYNPFLI